MRKDLNGLLLFAFISGIFLALIRLAYALLIGQLVNAAAEKSYGDLAMWAGIAVTTYVVQELSSVAYNFIAAWFVPGYKHKTRGLLLVHWLKIVPKRRMTAGRMNVAIFHDLGVIVQNAEAAFFSGGYGLASALGSIGVMFWLHWILGIVAVGAIVIGASVALITGKILDNIEQNNSRSKEAFYGVARQTDDNKIQYVSMRLLSRFKTTMEGLYKVFYKEQLSLEVKMSIAYNFSILVSVCFMYAPIIAGALLFATQTVNFGAISILVILSGEISSSGTILMEGVVSNLRNRRLKAKYVTRAIEPIASIRYENFRLLFGNGKLSNYELNFEIGKGKKYLLKGPNGVGKSTALEVFIRPVDYQGHLRVNELRADDPSTFDNYYAVMPVKSNALFDGPKQIEEFYEGTLSLLFHQILGISRAVFDGKTPTANVSQGEQQLLSLLHTLANRPAVLIIDETLSSVQEDVRLQIYAALLKQHDIAVVVVDHTMDREMEGNFDEVVLLK